MSSSRNSNCNRQPFLSGDGCDRGSVDIHMFDDLPFCEEISPTVPEIPPEIVDTPLNLQIPPACSCVSIGYNLDLKYSKSRRFDANAEFTADGDCCEGNYISNFDLQIPCPIIGSGTKVMKMSVGYGNRGSIASVPYITTDSDGCTIEPKDIDISLDIPCPVLDRGLINGVRAGDIKIGIGYGTGPSKETLTFIKTNQVLCTFSPLAPSFDLDIPCPVLGSGNNKITPNARFVKNPSNKPVDYIHKDADNCTIEPLDVDLSIEIPCPIAGMNKNVKIKIGYGSVDNATAPLFNVSQDDCTIEPLETAFNLNIRCPFDRVYEKPWEKVEGRDGVFRRTARRIVRYLWRDNESFVWSGSPIEIEVDKNECTVDMSLPDMNIELPCPLDPQGEEVKRTLNLRQKYTYDNDETSIDILEYNTNKCLIEVPEEEYDLNIKCPIERGAKINLRKAKYGNPADKIVSLKDSGDDCLISGVKNLELVIPCALDNLKMYTLAGDEIESRKTGDCGKVFFIDVKGGGGGGGGGGGDICIDYVSEIRYRNSSLEYKKTSQCNGKTRSKWIRILTATNHMSDHACCNDA